MRNLSFFSFINGRKQIRNEREKIMCMSSFFFFFLRNEKITSENKRWVKLQKTKIDNEEWESK